MTGFVVRRGLVQADASEMPVSISLHKAQSSTIVIECRSPCCHGVPIVSASNDAPIGIYCDRFRRIPIGIEIDVHRGDFAEGTVIFHLGDLIVLVHAISDVPVDLAGKCTDIDGVLSRQKGTRSEAVCHVGI